MLLAVRVIILGGYPLRSEEFEEPCPIWFSPSISSRILSKPISCLMLGLFFLEEGFLDRIITRLLVF